MRNSTSAALSQSKYPIMLPLNEARNVVMFVTTGTVMKNLSEFSQDLWVLQGYIQGQVIGNPDIRAYAADADPVAELQKAIDTASNQSDAGATAQGAINWIIILKWVIELAVQYYLSK